MLTSNFLVIFSLLALTTSSSIIALFVIVLSAKNSRSTAAALTTALSELEQKTNALHVLLAERTRTNEEIRDTITRFILEQQQEQHRQRTQFDEHQIKNLKLLVESLQNGMNAIREQIVALLQANTSDISKRVDKLTQETQTQLKEISGQVEKRLSEGFEKTTATFTDVIKRLALIDEAQKKIAELSGNVISLQEILTDKRSRGAFGEIQLETLIRNVMPQEHFALQHTLSNGKRVDCILFLPPPSENIAIDAKFPLESYQRLSDYTLSEQERSAAMQQFRQDIRHHIQDIATKYIISGETAAGALMFIPAEAIFAEIHAHYPELVEFSHRSQVWMVSPTTMMAVLTTARAVLKDAATRQQIHIIQKHLLDLAKDFDRFQERMDKLAQHINQAHNDVEQVHQSSQKISNRFSKIEKVELIGLEALETSENSKSKEGSCKL